MIDPSRFVPPFAFAGWASGAGVEASGGPATAFWRAASISKIVTGQVAAAVAGGDGGVPLGEAFGRSFRHPADGAEITIGQVAVHSAGLWDEAGYLPPWDGGLTDWLSGKGAAIFAPDPPGVRQRYCNLGYLLLAAWAERVSGERFDRLAARHVLDPLAIVAGFNWAGLNQDVRARAIPTYRSAESGLIAQIDTDIAPEGIVGPQGRAFPDDYVIGEHTHRFSPQGGLRIDLAGALRLAQSIHRLDTRALPAGAPEGEFDSHGWGLQKLTLNGRAFLGHAACAYGMCGGVWADGDTALAYVLNGLPEGDDADRLRPEERAIIDGLTAREGA